MKRLWGLVQERQVRLLQVTWVVLVVANAAFFLLGVPDYHSRLLHPPATVRADLAHLGVSVDAYAVYLSAVSVIGSLAGFVIAGLIARTRFNDPMALLASLFLVELGGSSPSTTLSVSKLYPALTLPANMLTFLLQTTIIAFLYVFPNGRFARTWARNLFVIWLIGTAIAAVVTRDSLYDNPPAWNGLALVVVFIGGIVSQVYRYARVSSPSERQQTKWVLCGMAVALTATFLGAFGVLPSIGPPATPYDAVSTTVVSIGFLSVPLAIGIAVTRYRLWDIDVLINRTLVYASLTITLGLVYVGGVIGLQALFRGLTGQGSGLAVAISTLAIAALFQPLRRNIQRFIDQRFYRRKYDATRTLARFSERVRDDVDLEELTRDVLGVVQETMQPSHVSLWLRQERREGMAR